MCGITGFSWADKKLLARMTDALAHRGPDDQGMYVAKNVSLGHRRLSIIDTSSLGHQPMFNEDKSIAIVFNGEIWNHRELRTELTNHTFVSNSDTEVLIHGYEEWGVELFKRIEGMFALALWDVKKQELLLARDARGKKPLYYTKTTKGLVFASELKAFLHCSFITFAINHQSLVDYMGLRFVPGTNTIFSSIFKLAPGSYLRYSKGKLSLQTFAPTLSFTPGKNNSSSQALTLIHKAVEKRLMSDVPIGVFLSGGLDSSTLVASVAQRGFKVKTFSVGFGDITDETSYARLIAKKYKTDHHEIKLTKDILHYLPEVIWYGDDLLADPACLPTYLLCKEVSKKVRVVLSGEGGDEVFGGYHTFTYAPTLSRYFYLPKIVRSGIIAPLCSTFAGISQYPRKQMLHLTKEISKDGDLTQAYERFFYFPFTQEEKKNLFIHSGSSLATPLVTAVHKEHSLRQGALAYYFSEWLPNDLLMKADKMGMAHGLEIRTPFLDSDLIDYFLHTPFSARHNRALFRKAVTPLLPRTIMQKPKQGFTLPLSTWFTDQKLIVSLLPYFHQLKKRKIFSEQVIDQLLVNPTAHRADHQLWVLLVFELWAELYLDKKPLKEVIRIWDKNLA
ncbi:asparagine synthase (glutamine-hydrolyzing) [Candidatus Pacearchaeota archaeon]|nr:asparagine synthase (glutamine-hydrolyzing) [Candidatus Pacearchaeota archaeon]